MQKCKLFAEQNSAEDIGGNHTNNKNWMFFTLLCILMKTA